MTNETVTPENLESEINIESSDIATKFKFDNSINKVGGKKKKASLYYISRSQG